ncbi:hypothetical protein SADUNF_Sadunf16G0264600 [Salix dunnii]|uniref:Reverse transcriptase Ty1/copia-type domain-containing protein n=1 Tax=Salix dunnii TaxID=1413687 RepID=A0A835MK43_9ROSI|nr:hypothetical protein SADUNF_Sadunf16G0264600 [Salix dunnii]
MALRFQQVSGVDFAKTFSLVIKLATKRVVLALSVLFNVSNVFLHETLEEEIFIEHRRDFINLVEKIF